ncbi:MAG: polyprenyl synthetase family protein [Candidatus Omnitrophota bacterium]
MTLDKALQEVDRKVNCILSKKQVWLRTLFKDSRINEGKKLRARIFFAFSGNNTKESIKIASAIEMLHAATLVHDDIIDNSTLRRGKPPLHCKGGIKTSLLYGDWLFSNGFSLLAQLENPQIYKELTLALAQTLSGELHQLNRRNFLLLNEEEYISIIKDKSGAFFGAACKVGALMKGLRSEYVERAYKLGLNVGIAYQILDDTSDYLNLGNDKQAFKDLEERVITLPLIYLLKKCSEKEKNIIKKILQKGKINNQDAKKILLLMKHYNVVEDSLKRAKGFFYKAVNSSGRNLICNAQEPFDVLSWIGGKIEEAEEASYENWG